MVLSDKVIRERLAEGGLQIKPLIGDSIRPASICLHLSYRLLQLTRTNNPIDPTQPFSYPTTTELLLDKDKGYILSPKEFLLASTIESIKLPKDIAGYISNISGLARLGLSVALSTHVAPGFGERGPRPLTLELYNASRSPIRIRSGIRVCHLVLCNVDPPSTIGYDDLFPDKYRFNDPSESQFAN